MLFLTTLVIVPATSVNLLYAPIFGTPYIKFYIAAIYECGLTLLLDIRL